jgi:type I restriction enzyme M protein
MGEFQLIEPDKWLFAGHGDVENARKRASEFFQQNQTFAGAELLIEEFVRQWALRSLFEDYGYPREWIGNRITIEEPVKMGSSEKEADIAIKNAQGKNFLFIEAKKFGVTESEFLEAERQLESELAATHTSTIGLVTDGRKIRTLRKKVDPNEFDYIPDFPAYGLEVTPRLQLVRELPPTATSRSTGLSPVNDNYERVLFDLHSTIRDIDGLHADEALDEICKIIYAKIHDERETTKSPIGTAFRFQTYGASNASEVASLIRTLYEDARQQDLDIYSKRIPGYERSRGVFGSQIKLSDSALYQAVETLQEFSLIDSQTDLKGRAFQRVLAPAVRAGMGQYFTPDQIVQLAVAVVDPKPTDLILDPFCGSGHFLTKALAHVTSHYGPHMTEHDLHEFKFFHLHGIEKSDRMVRIAMTDMMLSDDGHTNIRNQDALLSFDNYPDIIALRDDGIQDPAIFDVVLTNPPFGSTMKKESLQMLGSFELVGSKKSLPLEVLGLERSVQFVKPGGKLAIVLPEHLMKGKTTNYIREWLKAKVEIKGIFFFPEEAFSPFGALVKTCLLIVQKRRVGASVSSNESTFLCEIENLGYDATGRSKAGSDLHDSIQEFKNNVVWS